MNLIVRNKTILMSDTFDICRREREGGREGERERERERENYLSMKLIPP